MSNVKEFNSHAGSWDVSPSVVVISDVENFEIRLNFTGKYKDMLRREKRNGKLNVSAYVW